ncbi:class I SAM-dependent methyltransferase [Saccharothrix australiensis]|uniref:Methyltransferase family protein n=1 Tax=Saccharothrix australiensis TaxID=2072 RepID=A0A495VWU7_9PSEU|nr:class I SAM-dependent methyltransferase [Saccharothrix australiensis]RKT53694.1 methyltransferase family protein [Saccharothrix australiensis]
MGRSFEELIAEADAVDVSGWDFSWLDGRATEERPPWGYQRLMGERIGRAAMSLDVQTGGGEVLAGVPQRAARGMAATESWPPNLARAQENLRDKGVVVVAAEEASPLPFADGAFDLVTSRHPVTVHWAEVARVLTPGGHYLSQQVGPDSGHEVYDFFLGPRPLGRSGREPEPARAGAEAAGLEVVDLRTAELRMEFLDVGAMVYFLRKVIWFVPDFTVEKYRDRLAALHERIQADGPFVAHSRRFLIEARKPARR